MAALHYSRPERSAVPGRTITDTWNLSIGPPAKEYSVVGASVTDAVLENVGLTVDRQDDRALIGMCLME